MSLSVDDLVTSLSSSHIGQEALDLATLQTQLKQALICTQAAIPSTFNDQPTRSPHHCQPSNTPTSIHTPSTSLSFSHFAEAQRYFDPISGVAFATVGEQTSRTRPSSGMVQEPDDEEMSVDDFIFPTSSPSATSSVQDSTHQSPPLHHPHHHPHPHHRPSLSSYMGYGGPFSAEHPQSSFAATDPFYQQAVKNITASTPPSVFSQAGHPAHHSPFFAPHSQT